MTDKRKSVYIVFSATDCGIGRFIRHMTNNKYNHVSLSLESNIQRLYSFARYFENAPFYAGYVEESLMRYQLDGKPAEIKVCRIELTDKQMAKLRAAIDEVKKAQGEYIYNFLSAACFLMHRRVDIPYSHTCVDFVTWLLNKAGIEGVPESFISINDLETMLSDKVIYEGESLKYAHALNWGGDHYEITISRRKYVCSTIYLLGRLFYRAIARFV